MPHAPDDADPALIRTAANLLPVEMDPLRVIDVAASTGRATATPTAAHRRGGAAARVTGTEFMDMDIDMDVDKKRIRLEVLEGAVA